MTESSLERTFATIWRQLGGPDYVREYRVHPDRRWRFDCAWPAIKIAIELDGGGNMHGRHHREQGHSDDCEKHNAATHMGWQVYRFTPSMLSADPFSHLSGLVKLVSIRLADKTEPTTT